VAVRLEDKMKKVTVGTYKKDTLYPKVVRATARILKRSDEISPVEILLEMGNLEPKAYKAWCVGEVPYLERVFQGSLSKANRILRIIRFHAHDLNMMPNPHTYKRKGKNTALRFSKSGNRNLEGAYACHFRWNQSTRKKQMLVERILLNEDDILSNPKAANVPQ
jgi:hypothetical protein